MLYLLGISSVFNGVSPSGKAAVFGTAIRRFESFHPSYFLEDFTFSENLIISKAYNLEN